MKNTHPVQNDSPIFLYMSLFGLDMISEPTGNKSEPLEHAKAQTRICKLVLRSQNWNISLSFTLITSGLLYDKV